MRVSLSDLISKSIPLTVEQQEALHSLVTPYCRSRTSNNVRYAVKNIHLGSNYGIYSRVVFDGNEVEYVAGQSYRDEIRTVRELILK